MASANARRANAPWANAPSTNSPSTRGFPNQATSPDALIELLNDCQQRHGYLASSHLRQIAHHLLLPTSRVWGTASFYHLFRFDPPPRHSWLICTGTACFLKGAERVLQQLQQTKAQQQLHRAGIELATVRCVGTCGGAPLAVVDGVVRAHLQADSLLAQLENPAP